MSDLFWKPAIADRLADDLNAAHDRSGWTDEFGFDSQAIADRLVELGWRPGGED